MHKAEKPFFIILLACFIFSSCRIQKHHYTSGFHFLKSHKNPEIPVTSKVKNRSENFTALSNPSVITESFDQVNPVVADASPSSFSGLEKNRFPTPLNGRIFKLQNQSSPIDTNYTPDDYFERKTTKTLNQYSRLQKTSVLLSTLSTLIATAAFFDIPAFAIITASAGGFIALLGLLSLIALSLAFYINLKLRETFKRVQGYDNLWQRFLIIEKRQLYIIAILGALYYVLTRLPFIFF
jgi:hypothetical protein